MLKKELKNRPTYECPKCHKIKPCWIKEDGHKEWSKVGICRDCFLEHFRGDKNGK
jgi:hypothetical protein